MNNSNYTDREIIEALLELEKRLNSLSKSKRKKAINEGFSSVNLNDIGSNKEIAYCVLNNVATYVFIYHSLTPESHMAIFFSREKITSSKGILRDEDVKTIVDGFVEWRNNK